MSANKKDFLTNQTSENNKQFAELDKDSNHQVKEDIQKTESKKDETDPAPQMSAKNSDFLKNQFKGSTKQFKETSKDPNQQVKEVIKQTDSKKDETDSLRELSVNKTDFLKNQTMENTEQFAESDKDSNQQVEDVNRATVNTKKPKFTKENQSLESLVVENFHLRDVEIKETADGQIEVFSNYSYLLSIF